MNKFLEAMKELDNYTYTENGAVALKTTGNAVLDAFGSLAAMKDSPAEDILKKFYSAYNEDKTLAMKLLFYVRDIRGGQGMRRVFRIIARNLAVNYPDMITNNFDNFLFFGRGDDLLCLMDTPIEKDAVDYMASVLNEDVKTMMNGLHGISLLAKWMPSENASSSESAMLAKRIRTRMGLSAKDYRKMLSALRKEIGIVEAYMSAKQWDKIDFGKIPSRAAMIYSDAFIRHVQDNYIEYLGKVAEGKANINAGALFPVDIIKNVQEKLGWSYRSNSVSVKDKLLYDAMWKALPNYFGDKEETGICVVDTSGSMHGTPIHVAVSLGMYCADKCNGPFKNHFITFSSNPNLQEIKGNDIFEKVNCMNTAHWDMDTNIEKVFELILATAVSNNMKDEDIPKKLYIISDMQWNECVIANKNDGTSRSYYRKSSYVKPETLIETMQKRFADNGYTLPAIVYWNVRESKCGMYQQKGTDGNCCMVSGYSPSLFKAVIDGTDYVEEINKETGEKVVKQKIDPITVMLRTLNNERYNVVYTGC